MITIQARIPNREVARSKPPAIAAESAAVTIVLTTEGLRRAGVISCR